MVVTGTTCCHEESKAGVLERLGLDFLIDDRESHVGALIPSRRGLLWGEQQHWTSVVVDVLIALSGRRDLILRSDPTFILASVELVSCCGTSPAFILTAGDGQKRKVRACLNVEAHSRTVAFLRGAQETCYPHVARLLDTSGLAILKSYIPGIPLESVEDKDRTAYIVSIAQALAVLHSASKPAWCIPRTDVLGEHGEGCPLICGADNFNTIITPEGEVAFIDLEACTWGPRWIDLAWSEELLCRTVAEREVFLEAYLFYAALPMASTVERDEGRRGFLVWLLSQIEQGVAQFPDDPQRNAILRRARAQIGLCGQVENTSSQINAMGCIAHRQEVEDL